jgi:uncharacterized protein (DUF433 family)
MNWQDYIVTDPDILCGKPSIKGTSLSVESVPDLLADGWETVALQEHYPNLTTARIRAVQAYASKNQI